MKIPRWLMSRKAKIKAASRARLKATVLLTLEMITLTASREKVLATWLDIARPNHPELTDEQIYAVLNKCVPHY